MCDDRPSADESPATNGPAREDRGIGTNRREILDGHKACYRSSAHDMDTRTDGAVVINCRCSIDNREVSYVRESIDDRAL